LNPEKLDNLILKVQDNKGKDAIKGELDEARILESNRAKKVVQAVEPNKEKMTYYEKMDAKRKLKL
jgi:hypothetical protein